jgi:protein SCO1
MNLIVLSDSLPRKISTQPTPVRRIAWAAIVYITLALAVMAMVAFAIFQPLLVLPRIGLSPGFRLIDQTGTAWSNEDLRGHIVLYNFTYTNCTAPCPQSHGAMQTIQRALPTIDTRGYPVDLVTISFDPERDTPAVLADYAAKLGADAEIWHFLTGEALPLKYVIGGGFGAYYQADEGGTFTFEPTFALVDGAGILRAKYRTATPDPAILQRDLELIAKEAEHSTGPTRLAYEAAHLFLCYPK